MDLDFWIFGKECDFHITTLIRDTAMVTAFRPRSLPIDIKWSNRD